VPRVRPLAGGFEAWQKGGFPVEPVLGAANRAA
jgi:rhodanese-related sulfurtransferase